MRVQTYNRSQLASPMPSVAVDPGVNRSAYGAEVGQQMQQAGKMVQTAGERWQDEVDALRVMEAENEIKDHATKTLHDPEKGLLIQKGSQAVGAKTAFDTTWTQKREEIGRRLSQRQRTLFESRIGGYYREADARVSDHITKQKDVALGLAAEGATNIAVTNIAGDPLNFKSHSTYLQDVNDQTLAAWSRYGPTEAQRKAKEAQGVVLAKAGEVLAKQDNIPQMESFLSNYKDLIPATLRAGLEGIVAKKRENWQISDEADRVAAMFGDNLAGAASYIRGLKESGGGRIDETLLKFSSGDNPDWKGVTQSTRAGTAKVFSLLSSMGLQGEITSGKRDGEGSWHNVGGGADVWLADNGGNRLAADDARVKQVMAEAKKAGWEEVLYHDAGTGIHLHLGNYTGSAAGGGRDPEYYDKLEAKVFAKIGHAKQIRNEQKHDGIIQLNNDLVGLTPEQKVDRIEMDPYLEKSQKADLVKKITAPREKSDISVKYMLQQSVNDGSLSAGDVEKAARYLNETDLMNFMGKVGEIDAKRTNKETESADKKWEQDLQSSMATSSTSAEKREARQALAIEITERLDTEKVKGWARYARAKEIMKETGVVVDGKGDYGKADAIIRYGRGNRERFGMLYGAYDKRVVDLAISGHVQSGMKNPEAEEINKFLMSIGERAKTDTAAQAALDWHIRNRVPLTAASFSDTYDKLVK